MGKGAGLCGRRSVPVWPRRKSVYLVEHFVRLKKEEAFAIRWHMGGFDDAVRGGSYAMGNAFEKFPLAVKLHMADMYASYLIEARGPQEQTH